MLGDEGNVIVQLSIWNGQSPVNQSPGFALLVLTLLAWLVGIVLTLSDPQKSVGYWLCIPAAILGGLFSFLLWFAINAI
jgi:hypothetical protein